MIKVYYCNLCGVKCEYEYGSMPRICVDCESEKHKLYYAYEKKSPREHMKTHYKQGGIPGPAKEEKTIKMIAYHNEHPEVRQAVLARMFGLSRERVGQLLGRVRKNKSRTP